MSKIKDGVYIGNWRDAQNRAFLVNNKITHVLCSASELRPVFQNAYEYLHIHAQDTLSFNIYRHFDIAADFIQKAVEQDKGRILVHCFAGVSRSSTFVLAYLIKHHRLGFQEALKLCKQKTQIVNPNPAFVTQLKKWEKQCKDSNNEGQGDPADEAGMEEEIQIQLEDKPKPAKSLLRRQTESPRTALESRPPKGRLPTVSSRIPPRAPSPRRIGSSHAQPLFGPRGILSMMARGNKTASTGIIKGKSMESKSKTKK